MTGAAVATACLAYRGISNWIVELRGRTSFEVARGLMLATYKLRDAIAFCRSPVIQGREFPDNYPGLDATPEQEHDAFTHVYKNRWVPVFEALQDFDARRLESEALWGSEFRKSTGKLRQPVIKLHLAIESSYESDSRKDPEFSKSIQSTMFALSGAAADQVLQEITTAIDEIENKVRPHIGRTPGLTIGTKVGVMWKPNWAQWIVIWPFALLSLWVWTENAPMDEIGGRMAISLAIVGALLVWNLQNTRSR